MYGMDLQRWSSWPCTLQKSLCSFLPEVTPALFQLIRGSFYQSHSICCSASPSSEFVPTITLIHSFFSLWIRQLWAERCGKRDGNRMCSSVKTNIPGDIQNWASDIWRDHDSWTGRAKREKTCPGEIWIARLCYRTKTNRDGKTIVSETATDAEQKKKLWSRWTMTTTRYQNGKATEYTVDTSVQETTEWWMQTAGKGTPRRGIVTSTQRTTMKRSKIAETLAWNYPHIIRCRRVCQRFEAKGKKKGTIWWSW